MATLNLGRIKPVFRGAYAGGTAYVVDDIVTSGGETFICIQASTGNATSSASHWTKLAEKGTNGTNGTDVGTTLTTAGDILYRDGSGLQRLPKGTAGQVLQMNSGATAPEYGNVSSDYVKLITYNIGSTVSAFNLTGWINSAYKFYIIRGHYKMVNANDYFNVRLINNSGSTVGSNYLWSAIHYYINSGGSATSNDHGNSNGSGWQPSSSNQMGTSYHGQVEMHFSHDNLTSAEQTGCFWQSYHREGGGQVDGWSAVGWNTDSTAFSGSSAGINFDRAGSGSFGSGTITIYGLK